MGVLNLKYKDIIDKRKKVKINKEIIVNVVFFLTFIESTF